VPLDNGNSLLRRALAPFVEGGYRRIHVAGPIREAGLVR